MKKNIMIAFAAMLSMGIASQALAQNTKTEMNKAEKTVTNEANKETGKAVAAPTKVVVRSENAILHDAPANSKTEGKVERTTQPAPAVVHPIGRQTSSTSKEVKQTKGEVTKTTLRLEQDSKEMQQAAPASTKAAEKSAEKAADDAGTKAVKVAEKETLKAVDKSVDEGRSKKDNMPK